MARKKEQVIPLPNDVGNNFDDERDLLTFRPKIDFVSPDLIPSEADPTEVRGFDDEIGDKKQETENHIRELDALVELADIAEARIDNRVEALGGLDIRLDPIVDATVIAAMKRMFPTNADPNRITYDQYKYTLKQISAAAKTPPTFGPLDLRAAQENPYKTDFGGIGLDPGMARPEISSSGRVIEPLNLPDFVAAAIIAMFTLLITLIIGLIKSVVGL